MTGSGKNNLCFSHTTYLSDTAQIHDARPLIGRTEVAPMQQSTIIPPGSTLGVFGGGQLGRMFAMAAHQLGYRVAVFSPEADCPAGQVADTQFLAPYDDGRALQQFREAVDVATIEFENIPLEALEIAAQEVPVRPGVGVLRAIQNRLREKSFLTTAGFPVAAFQAISSESDLEAISREHLPGVLKTAASGYDGKGQQLVDSMDQVAEAWQAFGQVECVLESFVEFECEFSVIVARGQAETVHYAPILNHHRNHILDVSVSPSEIPPDACERAVEIARGVAEALEYVGVMCVEFFLARDGRVVINEIAPRPHNSGHLTIEAHATSQFQQQVRAICGLPLGSTQQWRPAAMANLLGDEWNGGTPAWPSALEDHHVMLHLYGKHEPRPGRKMGHLTCTAETSELASRHAMEARERLTHGE